MPTVRISVEAEADLDSIAAYSISTWGPDQVARYLDALEKAIQLLVQNRSLGRGCDRVRQGLRRFEVEKHVIFYMQEDDGVLIVRVLHASMLPRRHMTSAPEEESE